MRQKLRTLLLGSLVIVVIATVALLVSSTGRAPLYSPLANPNGYDDFLKAAGLLEGDVANALELDHDRLRGLVSSNAAALSLLRLGLTRHGSVPTEEALTNFSLVAVS